MSDLIDRHEAIRDIRLMDVCVIYDDMCSTEEAVEKAIVATKRNAIFGLERMPSAQPEHLVKDLVNDCINRQDAIDAIHEDADWLAAQGSDWQVERMERDKSILMSLPSAGPEIIRCRDCKHHDGIRCFRWNSTIITGFDDFCSNAERRTDE